MPDPDTNPSVWLRMIAGSTKALTSNLSMYAKMGLLGICCGALILAQSKFQDSNTLLIQDQLKAITKAHDDDVKRASEDRGTLKETQTDIKAEIRDLRLAFQNLYLDNHRVLDEVQGVRREVKTVQTDVTQVKKVQEKVQEQKECPDP